MSSAHGHSSMGQRQQWRTAQPMDTHGTSSQYQMLRGGAVWMWGSQAVWMWGPHVGKHAHMGSCSMPAARDIIVHRRHTGGSSAGVLGCERGSAWESGLSHGMLLTPCICLTCVPCRPVRWAHACGPHVIHQLRSSARQHEQPGSSDRRHERTGLQLAGQPAGRLPRWGHSCILWVAVAVCLHCPVLSSLGALVHETSITHQCTKTGKGTGMHGCGQWSQSPVAVLCLIGTHAHSIVDQAAWGRLHRLCRKGGGGCSGGAWRLLSTAHGSTAAAASRCRCSTGIFRWHLPAHV